ncbi:hypothetical protein GCM10011428_57000 [Streptomyces violaceus]
MTEKYAVVVVGGGAAGLSAALVLGRARQRTLVVDAGEPRNAPAAHMQGFLTRDGMPPAEFLAIGREEIARYGVELVRDRVVEVERGRDGTVEQGEDFAVVLAGGRTVRARRLVVATGLRDELPAVPGLAERFGRDVLHCPFCHGWEVRDQPFGVLGTAPTSVHQALMVSQWSKDVRFFLHTVAEEELSDEDLRRLAAAGVDVVPGEVAGWWSRTTGSPASGSLGTPPLGKARRTPAPCCSSPRTPSRRPACWNSSAPSCTRRPSARIRWSTRPV